MDFDELDDAELNAMTLLELQRTIHDAGLCFDDCFKRESLCQRAREARAKVSQVPKRSDTKITDFAVEDGLGLYRQYRVDPAVAELPVRETPALSGKVWATHRAGGLVFTTGKVSGNWMEVCTCIGFSGWILPSSRGEDFCLLPVEGSGRHGDQIDDRGRLRFAKLLAEHANAMLKFELLELLVTQILPAPGYVRLERGVHKAHLFTPAKLSEGMALPLVVVFHGYRFDRSKPFFWATRFAEEATATKFNILILAPEAEDNTWDLFTTGSRKDLNFVQAAVNEVRGRYLVDDGRIAAFGHSDGGSIAISLAVRNPHIFQAALATAAGRCAVDLPRSLPSPDIHRPKLFMEYGTKDDVFDYSTVALKLKDRLERAGYSVQFRGVLGAGHLQRPEFVRDAFKFWLSLPRHPAVSNQAVAAKMQAAKPPPRGRASRGLKQVSPVEILEELT